MLRFYPYLHFYIEIVNKSKGLGVNFVPDKHRKHVVWRAPIIETQQVSTAERSDTRKSGRTCSSEPPWRRRHLRCITFHGIHTVCDISGQPSFDIRTRIRRQGRNADGEFETARTTRFSIGIAWQRQLAAAN